MALDGDTIGTDMHGAHTAGRSTSLDALDRWKTAGGVIADAVNTELANYATTEGVDTLLEDYTTTAQLEADYYDAAEVDALLPGGSALRHAVATPGAQAGAVITVAVQIKDGADASVEEATPLLATLLDGEMVPELEAVFTMAQTGGTLHSSSAKPALYATTSALGVINLAVTDVGGSSGLTTYLKLETLPGVGKAGQTILVPLAFAGP